MIGYDTGGPGGRGWDPLPAAERVRTLWEARVPAALAPVWGWVEETVTRLVPVLATVEVLTPIPLERWLTAGDERACPECAPLHGRVWRAGDGPAAPLHVNCRCRRVAAGVKWQRREVLAWRERMVPQARLRWRVTGWR